MWDGDDDDSRSEMEEIMDIDRYDGSLEVDDDLDVPQFPPPFDIPLPSAHNSSNEDLNKRVESVLDYILLSGLTLDAFLDAVCWGNAQCIQSHKVRWHRSSFTNSSLLPGILSRL